MSRFCKSEDGNLTVVFDTQEELLEALQALYYLAKKYERWPKNGIAAMLRIKEQDAKGDPQ